MNEFVLCRSDRGDGGWSLHAPGSTDEDIASGDAPPLICGTSLMVGQRWQRPDADDYVGAEEALAARDNAPSPGM